MAFTCDVTGSMMTDKQRLFKQGLNNEMLAEKLGTKSPYVSMFITSRGDIPRKDWQILYEYFLELRCQ